MNTVPLACSSSMEVMLAAVNLDAYSSAREGKISARLTSHDARSSNAIYLLDVLLYASISDMMQVGRVSSSSSSSTLSKALSGGASRFARFDVFALIAVARGVSRLPLSPRLISLHSIALATVLASSTREVLPQCIYYWRCHVDPLVPYRS